MFELILNWHYKFINGLRLLDTCKTKLNYNFPQICKNYLRYQLKLSGSAFLCRSSGGLRGTATARRYILASKGTVAHAPRAFSDRSYRQTIRVGVLGGVSGELGCEMGAQSTRIKICRIQCFQTRDFCPVFGILDQEAGLKWDEGLNGIFEFVNFFFSYDQQRERWVRVHDARLSSIRVEGLRTKRRWF